MLLQPVWAEEDPATVLVEQGHFWQSRDDGKRASEAWSKLLLIIPEHPQALYGLAATELRTGRIETARAYLQRLQKAHPGSPLIAQLEQDIRLSSDKNKALLAKAQQAVASSDVDEAAKKYREALGDSPPVGEVGRDYYHRLGYTENGLLEAIAGLRRLETQSPDDPLLKLALARHLARNEPTRLEGIVRLARLADNPEIGSEATESWRDGLKWLGPPGPEVRHLFTEYLNKYPDDSEIRDRLQQGMEAARQEKARSDAPRRDPPRPDPLRQRTDAAMKLIESGNTERARAEFKAVLAQRPNDSEALGGMGVLAMREGNWQQAHDYLVRARQGNAAWQPSLSIAQYWVDVDKARVMLQNGKAEQALEAYQRLLQRRPQDVEALLGLQRAANQLSNSAAARAALENALSNNPDNVGLRHELARHYREAGQASKARGLIDEALRRRPDDPEALYAAALQASDQQQWAQAREMIERIPPVSRTASTSQLYAMIGLREQLIKVVGMARAGRKSEALSWLQQIEAAGTGDADVLDALALAYVEIGEPEQGLGLIRPLREQGRNRSVDGSIAYAGLLLASEQDIEASAVLRQLPAAGLTDAQRRLVGELGDVSRIRQADLLTERSDFVAAYDVLASVLARRPDDAMAQGALARMYLAAGKGEKALEIYEALVRSHPHDPDVRLGLAQVAQRQGDLRRARREADAAVSLAPENGRVLRAAADVYRAFGKSDDAVKLEQRAMSLQAQGIKYRRSPE
ncbi:tetratricopeptide repeat protein [Pusillimonas sp.]|uniref:tetratricopeptide repeat protein n=1 Tax=Pusillimonas sp. TaxID=3040095 RepID=UPI0029A7B785|nr:tetratricopeptide repeat protein [Pusillimonas sp.]MDX3895525.1 tetratricopeptide repeat protein [Pusillimonas sp.]